MYIYSRRRNKKIGVKDSGSIERQINKGQCVAILHQSCCLCRSQKQAFFHCGMTTLLFYYLSNIIHVRVIISISHTPQLHNSHHLISHPNHFDNQDHHISVPVWHMESWHSDLVIPSLTYLIHVWPFAIIAFLS